MEKRLLITALAGLLGGLGVTQVVRIAPASTASEPGTRSVAELSRELEELGRELTASRLQLAEVEARAASAQTLAQRLDRIEADFHGNRTELDTELRSMQDRQLEIADERVGARLEELNRALERRWSEFQEALGAARHLAESNQGGLLQLESRVHHDTTAMWDHLMGPTVQLTGESTVGSGVLLPSEPRADGKGHRTMLLTAWHVVRDILSDPDQLDEPVPVHVYHPDGSIRYETARVLARDVGIDIALLEMETSERFEHGARLAPRARLDHAEVFDPIYAVGCPLGNDPIPTYGQLADTSHSVDGDRYWMISAPTYIGNSGGGIYDAENFELLGIFSKIYTHGSLRPTVVPHMGLVTPLPTVYEWLDEVGYTVVETSDPEVSARIASADRE